MGGYDNYHFRRISKLFLLRCTWFRIKNLELVFPMTLKPIQNMINNSELRVKTF